MNDSKNEAKVKRIIYGFMFFICFLFILYLVLTFTGSNEKNMIKGQNVERDYKVEKVENLKISEKRSKFKCFNDDLKSIEDIEEVEIPKTGEITVVDYTATILKPTASGVKERRNTKAVIDYSNIIDGYVMVQFFGETEKRLKAQVKGPNTVYTYNITKGEWSTFPLSDGNGEYRVVVYENTKDSKYATVLSETFTVENMDEFNAFIRPNQYVNYENAVETIKKSNELCKDVETDIDKLDKIYNYVIDNFVYDTDLAQSVKSGYLPVLDTVLQNKKGICFDYAALTTALLRIQKIPCKLVVGYAGTQYHAWISVYLKDLGWVDGAIYFDGISWKRMDPTFASGNKDSSAILKYISNNENYTDKYYY